MCLCVLVAVLGAEDGEVKPGKEGGVGRWMANGVGGGGFILPPSGRILNRVKNKVPDPVGIKVPNLQYYPRGSLGKQ